MRRPDTRAVLIDALGTLVALAPPGLLLAAELRREHALAVSDEQTEEAFEREMAYYRAHHHEACDEPSLADLHGRCADVLAAALPSAVADALGGEGMVAAMLASLRFSAHPDAARTLDVLRARGMKVVVVSNWDCSLPAVLQRVGLADALDAIVTSGELGVRKPDRGIFAAALDVAGVGAAEAVHVGDSIDNDVLGARGAGIAAVLLRRPPAAPLGADERPPDGVPVISSLDDLTTAIPRARRLGSLE